MSEKKKGRKQTFPGLPLEQRWCSPRRFHVVPSTSSSLRSCIPYLSARPPLSHYNERLLYQHQQSNLSNELHYYPPERVGVSNTTFPRVRYPRQGRAFSYRWYLCLRMADFRRAGLPLLVVILNKEGKGMKLVQLPRIGVVSNTIPFSICWH